MTIGFLITHDVLILKEVVLTEFSEEKSNFDKAKRILEYIKPRIVISIRKGTFFENRIRKILLVGYL